MALMKLKTMLMQTFGVANKESYGNFRRGQLQSLTRDGCLQEALSKVI